MHAAGMQRCEEAGDKLSCNPPHPTNQTTPDDGGRGALTGTPSALVFHSRDKVEATCGRKPGMTGRSHDTDRDIHRGRERETVPRSQLFPII